MTDVVLLYEATCPNVREARANLLRAFSTAGRAGVAATALFAGAAIWNAWPQSRAAVPSASRKARTV